MLTMARQRKTFGHRQALNYSLKNAPILQDDILRAAKLDDEELYFLNPDNDDWKLPIQTQLQNAFIDGVKFAVKEFQRNPSLANQEVEPPPFEDKKA